MWEKQTSQYVWRKEAMTKRIPKNYQSNYCETKKALIQ